MRFLQFGHFFLLGLDLWLDTYGWMGSGCGSPWGDAPLPQADDPFTFTPDLQVVHHAQDTARELSGSGSFAGSPTPLGSPPPPIRQHAQFRSLTGPAARLPSEPSAGSNPRLDSVLFTVRTPRFTSQAYRVRRLGLARVFGFTCGPSRPPQPEHWRMFRGVQCIGAASGTPVRFNEHQGAVGDEERRGTRSPGYRDPAS